MMNAGSSGAFVCLSRLGLLALGGGDCDFVEHAAHLFMARFNHSLEIRNNIYNANLTGGYFDIHNNIFSLY